MFIISESLPIIFMAIALSMDAFSVSLGIGLQLLSLRRIFLIGLMFGFFHMLFPVIGIFIGRMLSDEFDQYTVLVSGTLLLFIGFHMFYAAFSSNTPNKRLFNTSTFGLLLLSTSVSIDSIPIGISLGMAGVKTLFTIMLFGGFCAVFTWTGLLIGRKVKGILGSYSELLGGSILVSFGLYILFSYI